MNMTCGRNWSSCAAGASSAAATTITVPSTLAPGTYYIGAVADYTGVQPETNETNNALAAAATVTVNSGVAQAYYIHADQLDTPRVITDTNGNVVWRWDNADPFGANMANENPNGAGTFSFNLRFPGQYYDRETNLHYNVNRDYDPAIGRYVQSDPIGLDGGINTYTYVEGDPLIFADINGLYTMDPAGNPAPSAVMDIILHCIEWRTGISLVVTSTSKITMRHPAGTPHARGVAVDIRYPDNPEQVSKILCAAGACGVGFALDEKKHPSPKSDGPHIHLQIPRGYKYGGRGDLPPPSRPCKDNNCS